MKTWRAWVQPPTVDGSGNLAYPWDGGSWQEEKRLIPVSFSKGARGAGAASFKLLRKYRQDAGDASPGNAGSPMNIGVWVAITADTDVAGVPPSFSLANLQWFGAVTSMDTESINDTRGGYLGTVTATAVGSILDQVQLEGWKSSNGGGGIVDIDSPPTANLEGKGGIVIGNRVSISSQDVFAFSALECGRLAANFWTRYRYLNTILTNCTPDYLPAFTLSVPAAVLAAIDDATLPEILDARNLSLQGAIDYCLPRPRGIGWKIDPVGTGWTITAYALLDEGEGGVPTQTPTTVDLPDLPTTSVAISNQDGDLYDQVVVQGAPIVFCGSIKAEDPAGASLRAGWSTAQLTSWKAGASASDGYASLTTSKKADRNSQVRGGASMDDVFVRYVIGSPTTATNLIRSTTPGTVAADASLPFFPEISWNGTAAALDNTKKRDPSWPSTTISRTIPWQRGIRGDGTDDRSAADQAQPQFLPPQVFSYSTSYLTGEPAWQDLTKEGPKTPGKQRAPVSVSIDDRGTALRIQASPPEWLAKGDWGAGIEPTVLLPTAGSTVPYYVGMLDWRSLVVTVAMPSDQRIKIVKTRAGVAAGKARRRLVIEDDSLHSWWIFAGTVIGLKGDAVTGGTTTPDRVSVDTHVRNDWPRAERLARMAAAWALSVRQSVSITLAAPDTPPAWAVIGTMLGTVKDGANDIATFSVVEHIAVQLGDQPRITVTTDLPERPAFGAQGSAASPAAGGGISLALGGTLAQAIQATQGEVRDLKAQQQGQPVVPARPITPDEANPTLLRVVAGNDIYTLGGSTWKGIKYSGAAVPSVPTAVPVDPTTYADGLGYGYIQSGGSDSGSLVWICNGTINKSGGGTASSSVVSPVSFDQLVSSDQSISAACAAGGTATVYIVRRSG